MSDSPDRKVQRPTHGSQFAGVYFLSMSCFIRSRFDLQTVYVRCNVPRRFDLHVERAETQIAHYLAVGWWLETRGSTLS